MSNFQFKKFSVEDGNTAMKVGTDGVLLGCWASIPPEVGTVIDAGCGCGLIALMMAQRAPEAHVKGIDIDPGAVSDARLNVARSPWPHNIDIAEGDVMEWSPEPEHPVLVISNPPFFNETLRSPSGERALARHGETFGVRELIAWSAGLMRHDDDRLAFIAPADRDDEIEYELALNRLNVLRKCTVRSRRGRKPVRTLWEAVRAELPCLKSNLDIRDEQNALTEEYIKLTSDFYLDK